MIVRAYAKINWFLQVIGKKENGYHDLEMIMQHIDLYDELHIKQTVNKGLILQINNSEVLAADDSNLIIKAANLIRNAGGILSGLHIRLSKHIPIGAGLGGGSADAAAVLHALNLFYKLNYPLIKLQELGIKIGADVPYCLEEKPAIVKGVGENVIPVSFAKEHWMVLLKPEESLSTKDVFSHYNINNDLHVYNLEKSINALEINDFIELNKYCGNSLEAPAIAILPEIEILKSELTHSGALFAQMSGSGSAVFGVFDTQNEAKKAWSILKMKYHNCILTRSLKKATAILSEQ